MQPADGGPVERLELDQRPDVLHAWVAQLRQRFHGRPVGIALEQRKGAVIHALMMYEFLVLYPVNPKAVARYREVFAPSGAKDDQTDAALLLDLLCTHRDKLRVWTPDTVEARTLCLLCEQRRKLVHHRVAVTNRLTSVLKQYFPQALDWVGTLASRQGCDFLRRWSTLAAVQRARAATLRRFYHQHNCRRAEVVGHRLEQIATAVPLTTDPAIIDPLSLVVQTYATQLRSLLEAIEAFDAQIAAVFASHPDHDLFASFPGAGPVCAPRLAAAFGTDRTRWAAATELQAHAGIAPVTERSGKACWVHHRLACPKFLKQTFHEYADQSIRFSAWARAYYDQQRGRGNDHHAALRALAFKWMRILFRCWQDRTSYDEATYLDALRRRGSALVKDFGLFADLSTAVMEVEGRCRPNEFGVFCRSPRSNSPVGWRPPARAPLLGGGPARRRSRPGGRPALEALPADPVDFFETASSKPMTASLFTGST